MVLEGFAIDTDPTIQRSLSYLEITKAQDPVLIIYILQIWYYILNDFTLISWSMVSIGLKSMKACQVPVPMVHLH